MTTAATRYLESSPTTEDAIRALREAVERLYADDIGPRADKILDELLDALDTAADLAGELDDETA